MVGARIVAPDADPGLELLLRAAGRGDAWDELGGLRVETDGPLGSAEEYISRIGDAEGVVLGWNLPSGVISACPNLRIISFLGTGVANFVDQREAANRGITVTNTPSYGDAAVAEHTLALILASLRKVSSLDSGLARGEWISGGGMELSGKTVGVVGLGGIGTRVARLLDAFGCRVLCWTRNPSPDRGREVGVEFVDLEEVFERSEVLSLHLMLTEETRGLVTANLLGRLRRGALLVNTARAELVDEEALLELLRQQRIRAALDVFTVEPLPQDHRFRGIPGVLITPHVGYDTPEARERMMDITLLNFVEYYSSNPINVVTI